MLQTEIPVVALARDKANRDQSTIRYEIMRGLRRVGGEVRNEDIVKDARRGKFSRQKM